MLICMGSANVSSAVVHWRTAGCWHWRQYSLDAGRRTWRHWT